MIELINNCIFKEFEKCDNQALLHQANIEGAMGAGIAKAILARYPNCNESFKRVAPFLGEVAVGKAKNGFIFHIFAQSLRGHGRKTNYEALYKGLEATKRIAKSMKINSFLIPYGIGCGLGGGDWRIVGAIIDVIFGDDKEIAVKICKI